MAPRITGLEPRCSHYNRYVGPGAPTLVTPEKP